MVDENDLLEIRTRPNGPVHNSISTGNGIIQSGNRIGLENGARVNIHLTVMEQQLHVI